MDTPSEETIGEEVSPVEPVNEEVFNEEEKKSVEEEGNLAAEK